MMSETYAADDPVPSIATDTTISRDRSIEPLDHLDGRNHDGAPWAAFLRRHFRILVAGGATAALLAVAVTLLLPKKYTTTLSFTPVQSPMGAAALANLAGQFGINVPASDASSSPEFYASLVGTRAILERIATREYIVPSAGTARPRSLIDLYHVDEGSPPENLAEILRVLQEKLLTVGFDRQTGIVRVDVRTKWPELSLGIAVALDSAIDDFNLHSRQIEGGAEARFLGDRVDTVRIELHSAEDALQSFLNRNRSYTADPNLVFEHDRLLREVTLRQAVYSNLVQAYEQARLSAVRNTPTVSAVETPKLALRANRRNVLVKAAAAGFAAVIAITAWLLAMQGIPGVSKDLPSRASLRT